MIRLPRIRLALRSAVLAAAILGVGACAAQRGAADAKRDLAQGALRFKTYGLPGRGSAEYATLLQQRYDVRLERVAGCAVTDDLVRYVRAYNDRMLREVERRHGEVDLDALYREATAQAETGAADPP